jgi:hypothetical protein
MRSAHARRRLTQHGWLLGLALACAPGCVWRDPQRWPGPMTPEVDPLPPGDSTHHPAGPEEVSLIRHADPVQVRPAGALSGHPLSFYEKKVRLTAGGAVIVAPGGRAELLWAGGTSIVLFGRGIGWVGSPSRGEPMFEFQEVERASLNLHEGDQVRLLGGSILSGTSGPYLLERTPEGTMWVRNQSKGGVRLAFREELFELGPGQGVLLPLLSEGAAPFSDDPALQRINGPGFSVRLLGDLEVAEEAEAGMLRVNATTPSSEPREVRGLGVRVKLSTGDSAVFSGMSSKPVAKPAPDAPAAQPPAETPTKN